VRLAECGGSGGALRARCGAGPRARARARPCGRWLPLRGAC